MRNNKVYFPILFLFFFNYCEAQMSIESEVVSIAFKNPYRFNSYIEEKLEENNQMNLFQAFLDYSNKGEFKKSQELDDITREDQTSISYNSKQVDSINSKYTAFDAVDYITEQAKSAKVIIINEAHHQPRHRAFTSLLLKELYQSGYTHLGLEALYNGQRGGTVLNNGARILDERDTLLNERMYAVQKSGAYIKEPQFGNLIREALEIGFTLFAYEKPGVGSGYPRELGQAQNIQAIINSNPKAKILIHCGFAHAYEGNYKPWGKAMASHLKELTGIDPLTINQVEYSERSRKEYNSPLYNALNVKKSSVLIDKEGQAMKFIKGAAYTDLAVIHPPTSYIGYRASWLFNNGVKKLELNLSSIDIDYPIMVLAFVKGEDIAKAIPVDLVEVDHNTENVQLALKPGKYSIVVVNRENMAKQFNVSVK